MAVSKILNHERPLIIKSFAYESSFPSNRFVDPFFKDIHHHTSFKERKVVYIVDSLASWELIKKSEDTIIPIECFYSIFDLLKSYFKIIFEFLIFPRKNTASYMSQGNWETSLAKLYRHQLFNPQTLINYTFFFIGKNLGSILKQDSNVFFTYENNCWERMFCLGLRASKKQRIKISAFQHSVMPEASLNMYLGETELTFVDFIDELFVTGKYPLTLIKNLSCIDHSKVKVLGTTRFNYLFENLKSDSPVSYDFLIALEGLPEASEVIERFIENCIKSNRSPRTLLRLHPAFGIVEMQRYLKYDLKDYPHISLSNERSVITDINRAKTLVYWGSTCSLEALMIGKPVIQCDIEAYLSYDPLSSLDKNRYVWKKDGNIFDIYDQIFNGDIDYEKRSLEIKLGQKFVSEYFEPILSAHTNKE